MSLQFEFLDQIAPPPRFDKWIAIVAVSALVAGLCSCGDGADRVEPSASERSTPQRGSYPEEFVEAAPFFRPFDSPGRWRSFHTHKFDQGLDQDQRQMLERLEGIGYLSGSTVAKGHDVTIHDTSAAHAGLNFYTSGHAPEAVLMDMNGMVLHRWGHEFWDVWPDYPVARDHMGTEFWRRAHLYENGDILAIYEGLGIIKLDSNSKLIWANPLRAHHDFQAMPNGDIYVLSREAKIVPRVDPQPILEDFVVVLDANGHEKRRVSVLESVERSKFENLWRRTLSRSRDLYHTNTLEVLDGRIVQVVPEFKRGNVLVYLRGIAVTGVIDLERRELVWARRDPDTDQHDPKILGNGNLMIFRNHGVKDASSIVEFDSVSEDVVWEYRGDEETPFFSATCGTAERLPNGNTLVTETDTGRAFELTPDKRIAWEFFNPHRGGDHDEFIATLFEVIRLPPDFPLGWARAEASGSRGR